MKTTKAAVAIIVTALIGLVVSVTAAWSQLAPEEASRERLGPSDARSYAMAAKTRSRATVNRPAEVTRSPATPTTVAKPSTIVRPVRITLSSVDIDATVRPVGVAPDGQMQLPPNPKVLGWYRFGPAPDGATEGAAVVAGHLDSRRYGLGPLVRLRGIDAGDPVQVSLSNGTAMTYRVATTTRFDQQALPEELFTRTGTPTLHIITCGGEYDAEAGGYQQNLVVTAVPV